eukprot:SAG31_NODE_411_length_15982_cov_7.055027_1_plen_4456_part_00
MKRFLLTKLSGLVGQYVDGIDEDSLEVGVWSGKIQLRDLKLKKESMDKLRLPLTVRGGYMQQLDVEWSWSRLSTGMAMKITIDTVYAIVCPNNIETIGVSDDHGEYYRVLGLGKLATVEHIEQAFYELSEQHRQKMGTTPQAAGAAERFSSEYETIVAAYDVLRDPLRRATYDACGKLAVSACDAIKAKILALEAADQKRLAALQEDDSGFLGRLWQRVIDNVQVTVKNVHFRFEVTPDMSLKEKGPLQPIALGVVMDAFTLQGADVNWKTNYVDTTVLEGEAAKLHRRLGKVEGFALYCDNPENPRSILSNQFYGFRTETGRALHAAFNNLPNSHEYLLAPLDTEIRVTTGQYPYPRQHLQIAVEEIHFALSQNQTDDIVQVVQQVAKSGGRLRYLQYRPREAAPLRGLCKAWWLYAFNWARWQEPREGIRPIADPERCTWRRFQRLVTTRNQYTELFKRLQRRDDKFSWLKDLTLQDALRLEKFDRELPIPCTIVFRSIAESELALEETKHVVKQTEIKATGWFSSYWNLYSPEPEPETESENGPDIVLTAEERQLLYKDVAKAETQYDVHDTMHQATLLVGNPSENKWCTLSLFLDDAAIVRVKIEGRYDMIRRVDSWKMEVAVDAFEVVDCQFAQSKSQYKNLVSLLDESHISTDSVLFASIEHRPPSVPGSIEHRPLPFAPGRRYDYQAELRTSSPLKVVINPAVISKVLSVFSPRHSLDSQFTKEAAAMYESWKLKREIELREALASRQAWAFKVQATAPIIVLPENVFDPAAAVLAIDLGMLRFDVDSMSRAENERLIEFGEDATYRFEDGMLKNHAMMSISSVKILRSDCHVVDSILWRKLELDSRSTIVPLLQDVAVELQICSSFSTTEQKTLVRAKTSTVVVEFSPVCLQTITQIQNGIFSMFGQQSNSRSSINDPGGPEIGVRKPAAENTTDLDRVFVVVAQCPHMQIKATDNARNNLVAVNLNLMSLAAKSEVASLTTTFRLQHIVVEDHYKKTHFEESMPTYLAYSCEVADLPRCSDANYCRLDALQKTASPPSDAYDGDTDLVRIHFHREDASVTKSVATRALEVEFNSLCVNWNPETVATLQCTFFLDKQSETVASASTVVQENSDHQLAHDDAETNVECVRDQRPRRSSLASISSSDSDQEFFDVSEGSFRRDNLNDKLATTETSAHSVEIDDEMVHLKVTATMQRFSLSLNKEVQRRKLVQLAMEDVKVEYIECARTTHSCGELGNLSVTDLSPEGATNDEYRELLGLKERGASLLTFDYEYFSRESPLHSEKGFDSQLQLHFSPMKFVYIQQQYFELLDYLYAGLLGTIFVKGREAAAKISQQIEGTRKDLIFVRMQQPMILIPTNPTARDHLLLYADEIVMNHEIDDSNPDCPLDHKRVILTGMGLSDGLHEDMLEHCVKLIVDVNLKLAAHKAVSFDGDTATAEPMMGVLADLDDVEVKLSHVQYLLIMDTLDGNIWAAPPETVQQSSRTSAQQHSVVSYQYAVADQPVFTSKYMFRLGKVSLTLTGEDHGVAEANIASMEMRRLCLASERLPDNSVVTHLSLGSIAATDCRHGNSHLAKIVSHGNAETLAQLPMIEWTQSYFPDAHTESKYMLRGITVVVVPTLFVDMVNFLTRPHVDAIERSSAPSGDCDAISSTTTLDARSFQVMFCEHPQTAHFESKTILLSLDFKFHYEDQSISSEPNCREQNLQCQLLNMQSSVASVAKPIHNLEKSILRPFDAQLEAVCRSTNAAVLQTFDLKIGQHSSAIPGQIVGTLSYKTVSQAVRTAAAITEAARGLARSSSKSRRRLSSDLSPAISLSTTNFVLSSRPWYIELIDDCNHDPWKICSVSFDDIRLDVRHDSERVRINGDFSVQVDRFGADEEIVHLMRPWNFKLEFSHDARATTLALQATNTLHMFLSNFYINKVMAMVMRWQSRSHTNSSQEATLRGMQSPSQAGGLSRSSGTSWSLSIPAPVEMSFQDEDADGKLRGIVKTVLEGVSVRYTKDDTQTNVELSVGGLIVHDLSQHHSLEFAILAESRLVPSATTTISRAQSDELDTGVDKQHDDLVQLKYSYSTAKFGPAKMSVDLRFTILHVEWNPETIAAIQSAFFLTGVPELDEVDSSNDRSTEDQSEVADTFDHVDNDANSATTETSAHSVEIDDEMVHLKVTATMQRFSLSLNKEVQRRKLVQLAMEDVKVEYIECARTTHSCGELGNLSVTDLSPEGATNDEYRELLGLKERGASLLTFDYEYFSRESPLHSEKGFDSQLQLHFSPMKFVYIQQQYFELLDYLYAGLLGTIFVKGREAAAKISQQIEGTRKDLIFVRMQQPMILIPTNPTARDHLLLYADEIVMNHEIDDSNPDCPLDHKRVILTGMGLSDGLHEDMLEHCVKLIVDVNLKLAAHKAVSFDGDTATAEPMMGVLADLDDVEVKLSHVQYLLIMDTLDGNIWAAPPETVQQSSRTSAQQHSVVSYQYAVADQPVFTSKYMFRLGKVSLTLTGEDHGVAEANIASMEMRRLCLASERLPDNSVVTHLSLGSIAACDLRQKLQASPFRNVFKSVVGTDAVTEEVVSLTMKFESTGKGSYELVVRQTEVTCVPATFFMLSAFFARIPSDPDEPLDAGEDYLTMLGKFVDTPQREQSLNSVAVTDLAPVSVKLVFTDSKFSQPYDAESPDMPCNPRCPVVEATMSMTLVYDRKIDAARRRAVVREKTAVVVSDIEIFRIGSDIHDGVVSTQRHRILPRTAVDVEIHKTRGGSQRITVEVDCVDLCITFNSATLLQKLLSLWYEHDDNRSTQAYDKVAAMTPQSRRPVRTGVHTDVATNEFLVVSSSICLTLINDKQQRLMPSLRLSITDANFNVLGSGKSYRALGRFVVGAQYYNVKIAEWQQLLILPRIEAEMDTSVHPPSVKLDSVAIPTLVITDAVLATVAGLTSAFAEDDDGADSSTKLVNNTGCSICFWTGSIDDPPELCGENMLPSGMSAPIAISNPYPHDQAEGVGEWDFEEQIDGDADWTAGMVTWTPYEMEVSQAIEKCYQRMAFVSGRTRPRLTEIRVKCGSWIDGIEFTFQDDTSVSYGNLGARGAVRHAFKLREGEYLSRIDWRRGENYGRGSFPAVLQVQFWSSSSRSSRVYGQQEEGSLLSEMAGPQEEICGLSVVDRPSDGGGGLQSISGIETRPCFGVIIGAGRHVDTQLEREIVTRDPRMFRRVKRREVVHTDFFVDTRPAHILVHPDYHPCSVPIKNVGRHVQLVKARDAQKPSLVLVTVVHCEKGRMVVSCESSLQIKNFTDIDLEVLAWVGGELRSAGIVSANGLLSIPILSATSSEVRVRPTNGSMCSAPLLVTTGANQQVVQWCGPEDDDLFIVDAEVIAEADLIPTSVTDNMLNPLQVCIYPPLTLHNHLPASLQYTVKQTANARDRAVHQQTDLQNCSETTGTIEAGDEAQVFCVSSRNHAELEIEIIVLPTADKGECWTGTASLVYDKKRPDEGVNVNLMDKVGRILPVYVEFLDQRTIAVYAACWVQNRTGISLKYKCQGRSQQYYSDGASGKTAVNGCAEVCIIPLSISDSKLSIGVVNSERFSKSIDTSKVDTHIATVDAAPEQIYTFWVQIDTAPGLFAKARLVTLTPYYVAANNLDVSIAVRQTETGVNSTVAPYEVLVPPGGIPVPFHPKLTNIDVSNVCVQISCDRAQDWCETVDLSTTGKTRRTIGATDAPVEVRFGAVEACRVLVVGGDSTTEFSESSQVQRGSDDVDDKNANQVDVKVNFPGFDVAFRDMNDFAMRHASYDATDHAIHELLEGECLTIGVGNLYLHTLTTSKTRWFQAKVGHLQIRNKCATANGPASNGIVFKAGEQNAQKKADQALFIEAKQEMHSSMLILDYLNVNFPQTIEIKMNDIWVLLFRAIMGHISCYVGTGDVVSPKQLISPMHSELARVESIVENLYVRQLILSDIFARVSFERTSSFTFPIPAVPQWLKFSIDNVAVDLGRTELVDIFGTWTTLANLLGQQMWPQVKGMAMDIVVNRRWNVLNFKEWAGRTDGSDGLELPDVLRIALNVVAGVPSKSVQGLGFKEEPLTNENILDKHWSAFRKCDSQQKFYRQLSHLVFDWDSNHCGLEARHCIAIAVINRATQPVEFTAYELQRGTSYKVMQKTLQALPVGFSRLNWNPAQTNVMFAWGNTIGGDVEISVLCNAFKAKFTSDKGAHFIKQNTSGKGGLFASNFAAVNIHKWWSTFVVVVGDPVLSADALHSGHTPRLLFDSHSPTGVPQSWSGENVESAKNGLFQSAAEVEASDGAQSTFEPEAETSDDGRFEDATETQILNRRKNRKAVDVPRLVAAAEARARTTLVQLHNVTPYHLKLESQRTTVSGDWTVRPPLMVLPTERDVAFGSESRGFFTGTAAAVVYALSHPHYGGLEVSLLWENPFIGSSSVAASVTKGGPLRVTKRMSVGHNNQAIFSIEESSRGP